MADSLGAVYTDIPSKTQTEVAELVEDLGYDSLWLGEGWGGNTVARLAELATTTDSITLGSGILSVYSRTPALLAMTGATLQRMSGGRFVLGVGASHPEIVESLHGVSYDRPIQRVRETVEILQAFTDSTAEEVVYDGEIFSVSGYEPFDCSLPVYNAALGPANRAVTGELCDGWLPNQIPISRLASDYETIASAARDAGRSPEDIEVTPWVPAVVHDDPATARDMLRRGIAGYVGQFRAYRSAVAASHPEAAERISTALSRDSFDAAAAAVPDDLVAAMGIAGTPDHCRQRLAEIQDLPVIDTPLLTVPGGVREPVAERTFSALAPDR